MHMGMGMGDGDGDGDAVQIRMVEEMVLLFGDGEIFIIIMG